MTTLKIVKSKDNTIALAMPDGQLLPGCMDFKIVQNPDELTFIEARFILLGDSVPVSADVRDKAIISGLELKKYFDKAKEGRKI